MCFNFNMTFLYSDIMFIFFMWFKWTSRLANFTIENSRVANNIPATQIWTGTGARVTQKKSVLCFHWLTTSSNSKLMHCRILILTCSISMLCCLSWHACILMYCFLYVRTLLQQHHQGTLRQQLYRIITIMMARTVVEYSLN